ncbi:hypothetical protein GX48_03721 [Paracoccidioides brasiliensis]|nr:hypothetical protein GX48_03721 [Paracoccidioides brasiliensis]
MTTHPYTIGTTFPTIKDAREALLRYTVEQHLSFRIVKSDLTRYSLACRSGSPVYRPNPGHLAQGFADTEVVERLWKEQFDYAYREYNTFIFRRLYIHRLAGSPMLF